MSVDIIAFDLSEAPYLPRLWQDRGAMERLDWCVRFQYDGFVSRIKASRAPTPRFLFQALGDISHSMASRAESAPASELVILAIRSHVTVFERNGRHMCRIALRDTVPGRPASMVDLKTLASWFSEGVPGRSLLFVADLRPLPTRKGGKAPGEAKVVDLAQSLVSAHAGSSLSALIKVDGPQSRRTDRPTRSVFRALDAVLRKEASAARPVSVAELVDCLRGYLASDDSAVKTVVASGMRSVASNVTRELLPDFIRDDLFSADAGSRLDAVAELGALLYQGDDGVARSILTDVGAADPSLEVRGFARTLLKQVDRPGFREMSHFGMIPEPVLLTASNLRHPLPELTPWLGGMGIMGVDGPTGQTFERPAHQVSVAPFRIACRPVTNRDYLAYAAHTDAVCPEHWNSEWVFRRELDYPVVMVSWFDAQGYCRWLTTQTRRERLIGIDEEISLPTEAEWELAARNFQADTHPWGDVFDPRRCNARSAGLGKVVSAGSFSPAGDSRSGVADFIGNAWEWTLSAWGTSGRVPDFGYPYDRDDGREAPDLPSPVRRIVRGGAFFYADICANSYTRNRAYPHDRHPGGGFRVVVRKA